MQFALIGNFGTWEIMLILIVALMVFGPGKLPEVAKTIGKTMGEIKKYTSGVQKEFQDAVNFEADTNTKKPPLQKAAEKVNEAVKETENKSEAAEKPAEETEQNTADTTNVESGQKIAVESADQESKPQESEKIS
ncbi:MAG TPA: twin-arginine translocase TatA/TatE family subunit [Syntrophomonadaceae bacterium]|nr:twin-arginine translocase TatA/TatE family subunit [Syntrophomonadaceae bacterium]HNX28576.1 twin-arginine translocase TatA/TatE family subunit [Syntrophomonadaceae bacterium]HPR92649.1 twin-arginine translocase TatA/TatE family subunit [Syntrophomonadaceae bacterium]